eukprot:g15716.t1
MNSLYIGSLSNPEKHPYVYSSRIEAEEACHKAGYRGLCSKSQIEGYARCAAGGWGAGKVGAYCCAPTVNNIQYIGSIHDTAAHPYVYDTRSDAEKACKAAGYHGLCRKGQAGGYSSNPKAHPYVYETKTDAEKACSTAGYQRLCRKFEIEGFAKCAAGWLADYKGYWFDRTKSGCGHGVGYRGWGNGKVGAYCCSPKDNIKFVGKLSDPSAMPYVYTTRDDAENACKKSGYRRLCYRSEIEFHSECKAGWMKDFKGYWFDRTHQHCGTGIGYRSWGAADAAGAYCCEKLELPLCHEDRLSASKGVWRCDEYSGTTGEENACVEKYQQIETDGKTRYFKCVASNAGGGRSFDNPQPLALATLLELQVLALPPRQYCWGEELTPELCCSNTGNIEKCMFDHHYFTQFECCQSNWAILDPYPLTVAPTVSFPDPDDWSQNHPAYSQEQQEWEELIRYAARTKEVQLSSGSLQLYVFKGDMPDIHLYQLESESPNAFARIVDIGANYGGVAVALAQHQPFARLMVLEPNPLLCRFLLWNIRSHNLTHRVWPLCAALGNTELFIEPCKEPWVGGPVNTCMNLAMRTFTGKASDGSAVKVPALNLKDILSHVGWESFDLLKLDCEGCEWPLSRLAPLPRRAVGELHFDCFQRQCWPPKQRSGNCSHVAQFSSLQDRTPTPDSYVCG